MSESEIECPFCKRMVDARNLADHAKVLHAGDPKFSKRPAPSTPLTVLDHEWVINENGIMSPLNPLKSENQFKQFRYVPRPKKANHKIRYIYVQDGTVPAEGDQNKELPNRVTHRPKNLNKIIEKPKKSSTIVGAKKPSEPKRIECPICKMRVNIARYNNHLSKTHSKKQLPASITKVLPEVIVNLYKASRAIKTKSNSKQSNLKVQAKTKSPNTQASKMGPENKQENIKIDHRIICPLCDHKMRYSILFAHIQALHPEKNAKLVMAEYNRKYREQRAQQENEKIERELCHLVGEYEK